ncbi:hypothetical protein [Microbacterium testaceum]|uniref:hypothetical protein n=1 Tax=Microbacterium testaceum TaxID=2033 RepID=UPI001A9CB579|nr:hypothetical protein [Microbacterium testaceum]
MQKITADFIEAHRIYQAELEERIQAVEAQLGVQPSWLTKKLARYREVHADVKVPE